MQRIATPTAVGGLFVPRIPNTQPGTSLSHTWCNDVQAEIVNPIEYDGFALSAGVQTQLRDAIWRATIHGVNSDDTSSYVLRGFSFSSVVSDSFVVTLGYYVMGGQKQLSTSFLVTDITNGMDTWLYLNTSGAFESVETAIGASEPSPPSSGAMLFGRVTRSGGSITATDEFNRGPQIVDEDGNFVKLERDQVDAIDGARLRPSGDGEVALGSPSNRFSYLHLVSNHIDNVVGGSALPATPTSKMYSVAGRITILASTSPTIIRFFEPDTDDTFANYAIDFNVSLHESGDNSVSDGRYGSGHFTHRSSATFDADIDVTTVATGGGLAGIGVTIATSGGAGGFIGLQFSNVSGSPITLDVFCHYTLTGMHHEP